MTQSKKPFRLCKKGVKYSHFCPIFYILHNRELNICTLLTICCKLRLYKTQKVC